MADAVGIPVNPKVRVLTLHPWQTLSSWSSLCTRGHRCAGTDLVPVDTRHVFDDQLQLVYRKDFSLPLLV